MLRTTMNALRFTQKGAIENLKITRLPKPSLSPGEALVKIKAAGINIVCSQLSFRTRRLDVEILVGQRWNSRVDSHYYCAPDPWP